MDWCPVQGEDCCGTRNIVLNGVVSSDEEEELG